MKRYEENVFNEKMRGGSSKENVYAKKERGFIIQRDSKEVWIPVVVLNMDEEVN